MMSGCARQTRRARASAGGQEEQPWLVKSSTTARGGSAGGAWRSAKPRPRADPIVRAADARSASRSCRHETRNAARRNSRCLEARVEDDCGGQRQRRCIHSHCSGCSRTQSSTTRVIACMAPCTLTWPSASRGRSSAGVSCSRKRWSGSRITRTPWTGQSKRARELAHDRVGECRPAEEIDRSRRG